MAQDVTQDQIDTFLQANFHANPSVCDQNAALIQDFVAYLRADADVSNQRIKKYLTAWKTLFTKFIDVPLDEADKHDMRKSVGRLQTSDYSAWTKYDFRVAIKKFYRTMYDKRDRPDRVTRILDADFLAQSGHPSRTEELEVLSPEEVLAMVDEGLNPRDRLMPLFFFESGARLNEVRAVTLGDITVADKYVEVTFPTLKNDKGSRTLPLTRSVDLMKRWLERHPARDDPSSHLFVTIENKITEQGSQLSGQTIRQKLKTLADRAGIDKRVYPHLFRHSSATYKGVEFAAERLMYWFGWKSLDSAQAYLHNNKDLNRQARLDQEGIDEDDSQDPLERKHCPHCYDTYAPTKHYCPDCGASLTHEDDIEEADTNSIDQLRRQVQQLKDELSARQYAHHPDEQGGGGDAAPG